MTAVRTRVAPSPTGYLHFGLARTALFCYLFARKHGGAYILRIEDTDVARNKSDYEADIHEQLTWLGLNPDERYRQSEHQGRHTECLRALIESDKAYISKEPAKDDPSREVEVVRLRNPGDRVAFTDLIRGEISFDTAELGDFVIARSMTEPLYHLAVVVDDNDEGVTHIIRGEDHISNTPRHILLQRALGFQTPHYAHIPLILMPDRSKMSKRKHESSVRTFREQGFLPEALVNYLALLGWNPGGDRELYDLDTLSQIFSLENVQKSGAVFSVEKLRWFNREYLLKMPGSEFDSTATREMSAAIAARELPWDQGIARRLMPIVRERISNWGDLRADIMHGEYDFFFSDPAIDVSKLPGKSADPQTAKAHLARVHEMLRGTSDEIFDDPERLKGVIWDYATAAGRGTVLWPLRFALSGRERSPDPFIIASIIGKAATLRRVEAALRHL